MTFVEGSVITSFASTPYFASVLALSHELTASNAHPCESRRVRIYEEFASGGRAITRERIVLDSVCLNRSSPVARRTCVK